jgi:hypothetical protein
MASIVVLCACSGRAIAGDLNPPAGPVEATMKSLAAIEPRVCVQELPGSADAVHVITEPGSYYLVADIVGEPGKHGILILADSVSIDLNGYSLHGAPGSLDGVHTSSVGAATRAVLLTSPSTESGPGRSVISGFGGDGVHLAGPLHVVVSGMTVEGNGGDGVDLDLSGVTVSNASEGFFDIARVTASGNGGKGVKVKGNGGNSNSKGRLSSVRSCMNGEEGVFAEGMEQVRLEGVDSLQNLGAGVDVTIAARAAGEGFFDFVRGQSSFNAGPGVVARVSAGSDGTTGKGKTTITDVQVCGNGLEGFLSEGLASSAWTRCSSAMNGAGGFVHVSPGAWPEELVTLTDCALDSNEGPGVSVTDATNLRIRRLGSKGKPYYHIVASSVDSVDIEDSSTTGGIGTLIESAQRAIIRRSHFQESLGSACVVEAQTVLISDCSATGNAANGFVIGGASAGGSIENLIATGNGGIGIYLGSDLAGLVGSQGVRMDACFASHNGTGIVVEGQNLLLRSGASHSAGANLAIGPDVFTGPSVPSPAWTETKPYAWP